MKEKKVIKLIGKETVLKFKFACDSTLYYETVIPDMGDFMGGDDINTLLVSFYYEQTDSYFEYETLESILKGKELAQVTKQYSHSTLKDVELFNQNNINN
tara:strand:+ start:373 stop:672 length:300 start_codon:yes stop_codon:yes gene_type:complete